MLILSLSLFLSFAVDAVLRENVPETVVVRLLAIMDLCRLVATVVVCSPEHSVAHCAVQCAAQATDRQTDRQTDSRPVLIS